MFRSGVPLCGPSMEFESHSEFGCFPLNCLELTLGWNPVMMGPFQTPSYVRFRVSVLLPGVTGRDHEAGNAIIAHVISLAPEPRRSNQPRMLCAPPPTLTLRPRTSEKEEL
jgi:hypothetical protein